MQLWLKSLFSILVLLFDHSAIDHFEDNDVVLPITVLEELDNFKLGNETKNYEARSVIRFLDEHSEGGKLNGALLV